MSSKFSSSAVKAAEKKRRLEIRREASRDQEGSPSPSLSPSPKCVCVVLTGDGSSNDARTAPTSTTKESSSSDDFNPALPRRNEEAVPMIETTVAILMEKNQELSLECDRLRYDLAAKTKNSENLVELMCSLRNERDMLKNKLTKQKEENIASTEKASGIIQQMCLEKDKSAIECGFLVEEKIKLLQSSVEYANMTVNAQRERQKAHDRLLELMLERCSEREETLEEMSRLVGSVSGLGQTLQNRPQLSSRAGNSSGTSNASYAHLQLTIID